MLIKKDGSRFNMHLVSDIKLEDSRLRAVVFLTLIALCVTGCNFSVDCEECEPPELAIEEINTLGATITRHSRPFPTTIDQRLDETVFPTQVIGEINLYFLPKDDDLIVPLEGIGLEELQSEPYNFTFSSFESGEYIEIPPGGLINETTSSVGPYGGHLLKDASSSDLPVGGNYVLSTSKQLRIPTTATHVELWYREDQTKDRQLIRRIDLESLYGWRQYFKTTND